MCRRLRVLIALPNLKNKTERAGIEPTNRSRGAGLGVQCPTIWAASPAKYFERLSGGNGCLFREAGERKFRRRQEPLERELKKPSVFAVIEAPSNLLHITGQVLRRDSMVGPNQRPFQQAPGALYRVSVNIALGPSLRVIYPAMLDGRELRPQFFIGRKGVGVDRHGVRGDVLADKRQDGFPAHIPHRRPAQLSAALHQADHGNLLVGTPTVWAFGAGADIGFVNLYYAGELFAAAVSICHRRPNPMAEIPSGFVAHAQRALELASRHTFLGLAHQIDGHKPLAQWQVRIVEDGTSGNAELPVAVVADELPPRFDAVAFLRLAMRAGGAIGPAERDKVVVAPVIAPEFFNQVEKVSVHRAVS